MFAVTVDPGSGGGSLIGCLVLLEGSDAWCMSSFWRLAVRWEPAWNGQASRRGCSCGEKSCSIC